MVTRWGSHVAALRSLLKAREHLRYITLESREVLEIATRKGAEAMAMAKVVIDTIDDPPFWRDVETVVEHLYTIMVRTTLQ